jgi:hypothetical protein
MRNYQKLYYQHYYEMLPNGVETEVTRRECFAPAEDPTPANPFKQRWFYDPEASYAVRLPRNQMGDVLGKRNAADLKAEERYQIRKSENCPGELDKPNTYGDDGDEVLKEFKDETVDILAILEDQERLSALISALDRLTLDDLELWTCLITKVKKQDIADRFNLTLDGVYYREKRLKSILRSDNTLKSFYTDN